MGLTFTDVHMGRQKVPKSDFQSQFSVSKIIRIFLIFFSLKNISLEKDFCYLYFLKTFWTTFFSKMVPNFRRYVWTSVKVKSFFFHVWKTPPLRAHLRGSSGFKNRKNPPTYHPFPKIIFSSCVFTSEWRWPDTHLPLTPRVIHMTPRIPIKVNSYHGVIVKIW